MITKLLSRLTMLVFACMLPQIAFSQIPTKVFEITSILVDGCDGNNEGQNEMVMFQIGPNPVNVTNLRVDGALGTGIITTGKWPNPTNSWLGIAAPPARPLQVDTINNTITNCGRLIEPVGGILPAGKKVLLITSTAFNPSAHSFASLTDTLYVIFQVAGNTDGHFVNFGTSSNRTLRLVNVATGASDTVIYNRSLLTKQDGTIGGEDGGSVKFSWSGVATYFNNGCQAPFVPLSAAWTPPATLCQSSASVNLNTLITGTTGGTWSGSGVTGNLFNPAGLSGNINVTYTVGTLTCTAVSTQVIQVVAAASAAWNPPASICQSAAQINLSSLITGTTGGTWSGSGVSGTSFNPAGLSGNINITYTVGTSPCIATSTQAINVTVSANPAWTNPGILCGTSSAVNLSGLITGTAGGSWSGTGVSGTTFNPSGLNGTYNITYTVGTAPCISTLTQGIQVVATPNAAWTAPTTVCQSESPIDLSALNTGTNGGIWSGNGVSVDLFNPAGLSGNVSITYTVGTAPCIDTETHNILVIVDADASWNNPSTICESASAINLNTLVTGTSGGVWSGTGVSGSTFNPAGLGGNYNLTYTVGTAPCAATSTQSLQVLASYTASWTSPGDVCITSPSLNLNATVTGDPGGLWNGTGITNATTGAFNPATAGAGMHWIVYSFGGQCGDADSASITVLPLADASITNSGPYCDNMNQVTLLAANTGGFWAGQGILNSATGVFSPANAGVGSYEIIYTISGDCGDADTTQIVVLEAPQSSVLPMEETCNGAGDGKATLAYFGLGNWSWQWSNGSTDSTTTGLAAGSHTVTITDPNTCVLVQSFNVPVSAVVCEVVDPVIYLPNIFTPNGDENNDILYVRGQGIKSFILIIYDRWGEKVFETTDLANGWDGKFRGTLMEPAVFSYYLKAVFENEDSVKKKGSITLVR